MNSVTYAKYGCPDMLRNPLDPRVKRKLTIKLKKQIMLELQSYIFSTFSISLQKILDIRDTHSVFLFLTYYADDIYERTARMATDFLDLAI